MLIFFFFKQKTAYEMRISDWSSDVCSSDLGDVRKDLQPAITNVGGDAESQAEQHHQAQHGAFVQIKILAQYHCRRRRAPGVPADQIGRASCRERGCQYV